MKKAVILGLSETNKLVAAFDEGQNFVEGKFEGFDIVNPLKFRTHLDQIIGKDIECSFNKNQKTIRYQNESFFANLIALGSLSVNQKELDESKLYTPQQKTKFSQIAVNEEQKSKEPVLLNTKDHSSIFKSLIKSKKTLKAQIESLSETLLVRFENEGRIAFFRCKIENCKQYFQLFPQVTFWREKFLPLQCEVKVVSQTYNILNKTSEVYISLEKQAVEKLVNEGWVALNQKNYNKNPRQNFTNLSKTQSTAIKECKGIYSSKSQIVSFIYAKNNYVGVVTNIIEGYIYEILSLKTDQVMKIELPMVICPIGDYAGAFEAREFARKLLIGKEVNVYIFKEVGLNITGNIIKIEDWKDIESALIESGYAFVREEFKSSLLGQKYSVLESKARQKLRGLHNKNIGVKRFEDLTLAPVSKAQIESHTQRRLDTLKRFSQSEEVVIQKVISSSVFKVRIESLSILLNLRLDGVEKPDMNPNLKEYAEINTAGLKYSERNFFQRTMVASITDFDDESNEFIGTLFVDNGKVTVQEFLIKESFVYASKQNPNQKYKKLETQAKKSGKHIWQPQLLCFEPGFELENEKNNFQGKFSWCHNGKVAFIQPRDSISVLEKLEVKLRSTVLQPLPKQKAQIGAWCAAVYDGYLYRAVIRNKKEANVTVEFIDWGNHEIVKAESLKELPQDLLYTRKHCIKVNLNKVAASKNKDAVEKVRNMLFDGGMCKVKKVFGDLVEVFAGKGSLNEKILQKGLLKVDKSNS